MDMGAVEGDGVGGGGRVKERVTHSAEKVARRAEPELRNEIRQIKAHEPQKPLPIRWVVLQDILHHVFMAAIR